MMWVEADDERWEEATIVTLSVLPGMNNSVEVVISVCGSWMREEEQVEVQLVMVHLIVVESERLQSSCRYEPIEKSWLRRYCNDDESEGVLGISVMMSEEQSTNVEDSRCDAFENRRVEQHICIRRWQWRGFYPNELIVGFTYIWQERDKRVIYIRKNN